MNPVSIPNQRRGIDGCSLKHSQVVSECVDLFVALGLSGNHVGFGHHELLQLSADHLGTDVSQALASLRPIELRALRAKLTGTAVRAGAI